MNESRIAVIWEHNGLGGLMWAQDHPGVCTRGRDFAEAEGKLGAELSGFYAWLTGMPVPEMPVRAVQMREILSPLHTEDADSDALFESERGPLDADAYASLRCACLKSAADFQTLYDAVPDRDAPLRPERGTFYGGLPATARQMYAHADGVTAYYFGEIGVERAPAGDLQANRLSAFLALEARPDFLENALHTGAGQELWTLKKLLRRFLWHDRIHARALWRHGRERFGPDALPDPFCFGSRAERRQ